MDYSIFKYLGGPGILYLSLILQLTVKRKVYNEIFAGNDSANVPTPNKPN